jgi:HEAT repeat protein
VLGLAHFSVRASQIRNPQSEIRNRREVAVGSAEQERAREEIRERFETLRGKDLTDAEVDAEVRYLLAAGDPALPVILAQFMDQDETLLAVATQTLKVWGEPRPVEPLLALLRNPGVDDLAKALILNILERYGLDVDGPEVLGLSIDLGEYPVGSADAEDDWEPHP